MLSDDIIGFISASGNKGFRPINRPSFLDIENFEESTTTGKKFHDSSVYSMYQMTFILSNVEAMKKTKTGPQVSFQTTLTVV